MEHNAAWRHETWLLQLRGEAGPRQVDGARIALAENGGGLMGVEEAAIGITIQPLTPASSSSASSLSSSSAA